MLTSFEIFLIIISIVFVVSLLIWAVFKCPFSGGGEIVESICDIFDNNDNNSSTSSSDIDINND